MKLFAAISLTALLALPAYAAPECASSQDVYDIMSGNYGESRQSAALSDRGYLVEVWANTETGTWTIIATSAEGVSCVVDQGAGFEIVEADPAGDPA